MFSTPKITKLIRARRFAELFRLLGWDAPVDAELDRIINYDIKYRMGRRR